MALPTSGALSLNAIHVEAGGTSGTTASLNDSDIRGLTAAAGKTINSTLGTNIDFGDFYGAAGGPPDSFGKTGVTPALYALFITERYIYVNTSKTGTVLGFTSNGTNALFSETSEFKDSNNNTQEILMITHNDVKTGGAQLRIRFLGHNAPTSTWTLSYDGVNITGNSGFTRGAATFGSPTTVNDAFTVSGVSYNFTQFLYQVTSVTSGSIATNPFTQSANQSWSIT